MDNSIVNNAIIKHGDCSVHKMPEGRQEVHEKYGLWICRYGRDGVSRPQKPPNEPRYFEFYCISHLIKGCGWYWVPGKSLEVFDEGKAALVSPRFIHCYSGHNVNYVEDTVCFTGIIADCLFKTGVFKDGIIEIGKARRLLPIIEKASDPSRNSQIQANIELQDLIVELYFENRIVKEKEKYPFLKNLIEEIKVSQGKWWTVSEMAEFCSLSEAQFRRVFYVHTGTSPKDYVDRLKIMQAAETLSNSTDSIANIAIQFGYSDPFHFSRRFKQITGLSPENYRLEMER
ncbi:MAG: AraC family transcriptional regulator [Victivallales bacterium]